MSNVELVRKMVFPTALTSEPLRRPAWESFVDEASGCEYLYNASTGESKWTNSSALAEVRSRMHATPLPAPAAAEPPATRATLELAAEARLADADDDEERAVVAEREIAGRWRKRWMLRTIHKRRPRRAAREACCGRALALVETLCCETPTALVEGLIRCVLYLIGALALLAAAPVACACRCCDLRSAARLAARASLFAREGLRSSQRPNVRTDFGS